QVTVYSDQTVTQNIGENNRVTISGTVFEDQNGNGVQDSGDTPVSGETVFIDLANDGVFSPGIFNASTGVWSGGDPFATTNANGFYSFVGLTNGSYRLELQSASGMLMDNPGFVDVNVAVGQDLTQNIGEGLPTSISGFVFDDKNANGVFDPGEPG